MVYRRPEFELPIADVAPCARFVSNVSIHSERNEPQRFVKGDTSRIRQCNSRECLVTASLAVAMRIAVSRGFERIYMLAQHGSSAS